MFVCLVDSLVELRENLECVGISGFKLARSLGVRVVVVYETHPKGLLMLFS